MGPQSRPAEFNLAVRWPPGKSDPLGPAPGRGRRWRVHFPRGERRDRLAGRQKDFGKVTRGFGRGCYSPRNRWPAGGPRNSRRGVGAWLFPPVRLGRTALQCSPTADGLGPGLPASMRRVSGDSVGTPSDPS
jgi:hypothetical protein